MSNLPKGEKRIFCDKEETSMNSEYFKSIKGIALISLIIIILSILIISAVAIVGVTKKLKNRDINQEISQETSQTIETKNEKKLSNTSKDTKVTAEKIAKNPEKYYGQEVTNYTKGDRVYRIFYVDTEGYFGDKNTIYLKADWVANDVNLGEKGADTYTPKTTKVLEKMNPQWAKERLNATWYINEKCAAWLCDPTTNEASSNQEWASYFDESKANYVIGSPSAEMFVKSYNQVPHEKGKDTLGALYSATNCPGYIYTQHGEELNSTYRDSLDCEGYNSMYCREKTEQGSCFTWLASPAASYSFHMCFIDGAGAFLSAMGYSWGADNGVSPIVSLKADFIPEI